jgi:Methyltransferase FkbM domain
MVDALLLGNFMPLRKAAIVRTYKTLLNRRPAGDGEIEQWLEKFDNVWDFLDEFSRLPEYVWKRSEGIHHEAALTYEDFQFCLDNRVPAEAEPGFITSAFGIRTRTAYAVKWANQDGSVADFRPNGCFEFDALEWFGMLKSVERAEDRFVVVELGAGWGPWMTAGSVFARRRGIQDILAIGVEGDDVRRGFISEHREDNAVLNIPHKVYAGVIAPRSGEALFPKLAKSTADMGIAAIFDDDTEGVRMDYRGVDQDHARLRAYSVEEVIGELGIVDVMHIDIQGSEYEVIESAIGLINRSCRHLIVATHSREIEWQVAGILMKSGWVLEKERPCGMHSGDFWARSGRDYPLVNRDGTQFWRNPVLVTL